MDVRNVSYGSGAQRYEGILALPDRVGPSPAVLIAHEAPGISPFIGGIARRLAELGYVALALDYIGEGRRIEEMPAIMAQIQQWTADPVPLRDAVREAHNFLVALPQVDAARISGFGYCFGAQALLEFARLGANLRAIVGFHPSLDASRPEESKGIRARLLMFVGAADPITPAACRAAFEEEMAAAGVEWQMVVYSGVSHAFTNPAMKQSQRPGFAYDERAAFDAWHGALRFLA